ncbi:hypothetical protein CRUP_035223, partial [Coryphaenoides rupestris]
MSVAVDCHCLLDIATHAIERLHAVHIYPIVGAEGSVYLRDKVSQKHSRAVESAQKTEQEYSKFFT